jgi:hypothetical protein
MMDVRSAGASAKNTEKCVVGHMSGDAAQRRTRQAPRRVVGLRRQQASLNRTGFPGGSNP